MEVKSKKSILAKQEKMIDSQNSILTELRDVRWLYNPVVYSQISGDFTLMQQRILIGIIEQLQQRIVDSVDEQHRSKSFHEIFSESELMNRETIDLSIQASDLGVIPAHYDQLEQAAQALNKITMKYPKFDKKGRISKHVIATLFPRIEIETAENDLRRTGNLRVVMLTDNIRDIFTMQHGFVRHVSHIARIAQKKRTPRLYIYLSRFKETGKKSVSYRDLVEYLGLTDEYYYESNDGKNPYVNWSKVRKLVLDPVKEEMDALAASGDINFSFTYEPIFPEGKKRGNPNEVLFVITPSAMGRKKTHDDRRTNYTHTFITRMTDWCPELSARTLMELTKDMQDDVLIRFTRFSMDNLRKIVERKQPDNVAQYAMGVMKKWIENDSKATEKTQQQEQGFKEIATQEVDSQFIEGRFAEEWKRVLEEYDGPMKDMLRAAKHMGTFRGSIYIKFPSAQAKEEFNKYESANPVEANRLRKVTMKHLGYAGRIIVRDC